MSVSCIDLNELDTTTECLCRCLVAIRLAESSRTRNRLRERSCGYLYHPLCQMTCLYVFALHSHSPGPAAIHHDPFAVRGHSMSHTEPSAIRLPFSTRHIRTPGSPPLTRYSPLAANFCHCQHVPGAVNLDGQGIIFSNGQPINASHFYSTHRSLWSSATRCSKGMVKVNEQAVAFHPLPVH